VRYSELVPIYEKVRRTIRSCNTPAQLIVAGKYAGLFLARVPEYKVYALAEELKKCISQQKRILRVKHGEKK